ncbi:MAG: Rrf2 family transcriptional regulator [Acidobacteriia bacterium]|nr:Rrf2 family transcriptional regulator [Terriglobia bacterium]
MYFSAQEEYGLRCLLRVAVAGPDESQTINEISRAEGISAPYAAKMMRILRSGGLVTSVRGQSGGYRLARPAGEITVSETLGVLGSPLFEGEFCDKHSGNEETCTHAIDCSIRSLWRGVQRIVDRVLSRTTIQDLLRQEPQMDVFVKDLVLWATANEPARVEVRRFG